MKQIDINCDLGEGFGHYTIGQDDVLLQYISSANIACGFHAGDPNIMNATIKKAKEKGVNVGAHPGFYDLHGFGRRPLHLEADEIKHLMLYQLGAIQALCYAEHVTLTHVKPHGALYNMASTEPYIAKAIALAVKVFDPNLVVYGLADSELIQACIDLNVPYAIEAFIDRTYQDDGTLTPRYLENSSIATIEESVAQALSIIESNEVTTISGSTIRIEADTLCIHGDHQGSVKLAQELQKALTNRGVQIKPLGVQK
ncbi:LamB/YcsF family protein [Bacillus suaedaesalsae]|uniref:5-oxoprolinase subunit A n=1 Tax=Bacillus suaedaesalsae TaxID=2810349 RepID=A0ABS2DEG4_9BACI|nr:5-oxoprolinase subunit PxpA [Bacillus suaedaesalsae]MBM6616816.1 LamB/YcsF family protein [Bacillus suaedaesalsae]